MRYPHTLTRLKAHRLTLRRPTSRPVNRHARLQTSICLSHSSGGGPRAAAVSALRDGTTPTGSELSTRVPDNPAEASRSMFAGCRVGGRRVQLGGVTVDASGIVIAPALLGPQEDCHDHQGPSVDHDCEMASLVD
jgi:hypothetical protein